MILDGKLVSVQDEFGDEVIHQNSHVITNRKLRMTFDWKASEDRFKIYIYDPVSDKWGLWKTFGSIDAAEAEYERLKDVLGKIPKGV